MIPLQELFKGATEEFAEWEAEHQRDMMHVPDSSGESAEGQLGIYYRELCRPTAYAHPSCSNKSICLSPAAILQASHPASENM